MQDTDDQVLDRLIAAGATDDEIVQIMRERKGAKSAPLAPRIVDKKAPLDGGLQQIAQGVDVIGGLKGAGRGLLQGLETGSKKLINAFDSMSPYSNIAKAAQGKSGTKAFENIPSIASDAGLAEKITSFGGEMIPGFAVSMGAASAINPVMGPVGQKLLGGVGGKAGQKLATFAASKGASAAASKAIAEAINVGVTTIPQELVAGAITEAFVNPESFNTWKGALRTGIYSSVGTLFNAGFAYSGAIKQARTLAELEAIRLQLRDMEVPKTQANTPTQQQVGATRAQMDMVPGSGQLPNAQQAAETRWNTMQRVLEEEAQKKANQLTGAVPKKDKLQRAAEEAAEEAAKQVDPLVAAQVKGVEDRMKQIVQGYEIAGKGVQTGAGVDLSTTASELKGGIGASIPGAKPFTNPSAFLTLDELNGHLQVLNMANVMADPAFKKGQRFIIPRTSLQTAEEIAARAMSRTGQPTVPLGGPIRAINKDIQQQMKSIQSRLDDAAAQNLKMLDPGEEQDIVEDLLNMSRRLGRGFEVPRNANLPSNRRILMGPDVDPMTKMRVEGLDIPNSIALESPNVKEMVSDDTYKRWVTGSDAVIDPKTGASTPIPPPPPEIAAPAAQSYADNVRDMNIDYTPKSKSLFSRIAERITKPRMEIYDRTTGIGNYSTESRDMLSLLSSASTHADDFVKTQMRVAVREADGSYIGNTRIVEGRTIDQIMNSLKMDEIKEVDAVLKAMTLVSSVKKNPDFVLDVPLERAVSVADNAPDHIKKIAAEFKVISDALVDDAVALGGMSAQRAAELKDAFYAGLGRSFNNASKVNSMIKRTGSTKASLSPLMLMHDNIGSMLEKNRRNFAYSKMIDSYEKNPMQFAGVLEPVAAGKSLYSVPGFEATVKELQESAKLPLKDAEDLAGLFQTGLDRSDGSMMILREGKPTFWRINGDIRRTVEAMTPMEFGLFRSSLNVLSSPTRIGVSAALDLSGIGPMADTILTGMAVPKFIPIYDSLRGMVHSALKTEMFMERNAVGGAYAARFDPGEMVVYKNEGSKLVSKVIKGSVSPFKMLQAFIRPLSDASRMGEYLVRRQRLGQTPIEAALGSRRTLGDFNSHGASMRSWSLITEFGNVGIQTAASTGRMVNTAFKEAKKGNLAPLIRMNAVGIGAITIPTVYFWSAAQGDDELNALRKSDVGYRYWWMRAPVDIPGVAKQGEILKYPKLGWNMGQIYGSSVEAMLDGLDDGAKKRFVDGFTSQVGMNVMPLKLQQLFGAFTGTRNPLSLGPSIPITPQSQRGLDPMVMGNERTSPLARTLADNQGINPFMTDYLVEAAGGNFFSSIVRGIGQNDVKLEKTDVPVFGRFFTKDANATEGSGLFYEDIRRAQELDKSIKKAIKIGDVESARKLLAKDEEILAIKKPLEAMAARIAKNNNFINTIAMDDSFSPESKREFINNLRQDNNELFKEYAKATQGLKRNR